ncbi:hypothetical protein EV175_001331 [Coemansia sp. RSA 1933]|nr:hypothetical protein EV175_001331 [Coemansia sp. RSA 1933]
MSYYSILDAAPSSASSTAVSLAGSLLSVLGTASVLIRLFILRRGKGTQNWATRHYLIMALATANLASSLTALLSGGVFFVYGRIPSQSGCTASGMLEYWAQQADGLCIVFMALVVHASQFKRTAWASGQHWVQHSRAPVMGTVLLLPLVCTVIVQIIWRFQSEELTYCWVPRVPVYARWVAIDAWRGLLVCALGLLYVRIVCARTGKQQQVPVVASEMRRSAIDSGVQSADAGGGLWSQSMHNMQRWARSAIGRSNIRDAGDGKRSSRGMKRPHRYYESFKRSLLSLITRRFVITTDIPSPTFSQTIFDNICKSSGDAAPCDWETQPYGAAAPSASATHCERRSYCTEASRPLSSYPRTIEVTGRYNSASQSDGISLSSAAGRGLRRWCSAVSRMLRTPRNGTTAEALAMPGYTLRRSHTAPTLSARQMHLCQEEFARPRSPAAAQASQTTEPLDYTGVRSTTHTTLITTRTSGRQPFDSIVDDYEYSVEPDVSSDSVSIADPIPVFMRKTPDFHVACAPQHLGIYTFKETAASTPHSEEHSVRNLPNRPVSVYSDPNAQIVLSSLEDGSWMAAVDKCRANRSRAAPTDTRLSRLYVYPLAYMAIWLPSLVYCVVSTYVYYHAFESADGFLHTHAKRSAVDLAGLPAHWTQPHNMHRAWPYYLVATGGVAGSARLSWLAVIQALHLLGGFVDAVLFWMTEHFMA